jgi:F0F1-type ATP synthase gamma subunit
MENQFRLMNDNMNSLAKDNIDKLTETLKQQMNKTRQAVNEGTEEVKKMQGGIDSIDTRQ